MPLYDNFLIADGIADQRWMQSYEVLPTGICSGARMERMSNDKLPDIFHSS